MSGVDSDSLKENGPVMATAVLAVLLVAFSTYGRRFCRHPVVRFVVRSASMVFLPLSSAALSALLSRVRDVREDKGEKAASGGEDPDVKTMWTILLWIVLMLAIKCNANIAATAVTAVSSPVGGDTSIDGNRISPPVEWKILGEYAWLGCLIGACVSVLKNQEEWPGRFNIAIFFVFSALGPAKLVLQLAAFHRASGSFALGKNARLIAGDGDGHDNGGRRDEQVPLVPRYIVMGEKKSHAEESPQGYRIKREALQDQFSGLVTLDRVWRLAEHGDGILAERVELRDLCLSYSLFKMLRRGLSGYPLADAGSAQALSFVLSGMDSAGGKVDADRVFRVLVDELWFASDFYYSPIPLCIFGGWCAALNYLFSLLIIVGAVAVEAFYRKKEVITRDLYKVITYSLLLTAMLVEAWEIIAGVCSNWTKMALLGHYIRHQSTWRRSGFLHAALTTVLRLRPARRWRDRLGQNSVLEPRRFRRRTRLLPGLLYGSSGHMKSIQVSPLVRDAVLRSLLSRYGCETGSKDDNAAAAARRVGGIGKVDWAWDADGSINGNTEAILVWHVATRLFEMKSTSPSPDMIAACHLSYYCAYLVAVAPELLPDSEAWTKKRYKQVSDDVRAALGADGGGESTTAAERYGRLLAELSKDSRDTVLRRGAELGRRLVEEYAEDEASACRRLADFWSEMVLFVAPSEKTKGHVQAMAHGGEFITLVWALLLHAGVTTRPDAPPGSGGAIP